MILPDSPNDDVLFISITKNPANLHIIRSHWHNVSSMRSPYFGPKLECYSASEREKRLGAARALHLLRIDQLYDQL